MKQTVEGKMFQMADAPTHTHWKSAFSVWKTGQL